MIGGPFRAGKWHVVFPTGMLETGGAVSAEQIVKHEQAISSKLFLVKISREAFQPNIFTEVSASPDVGLCTVEAEPS